MIEPPDIPEADLLASASKTYGLNFQSVSFLPLGADAGSAAFRLTTTDGSLRFLKLRKAPFEVSSVAVPLFLYKQGIRQVIAPIETLSGAAWTDFQEYAMLLYPYLDARNGYQRSLSEQHQIELGQTMRKIHSCLVPAEIAAMLARESFSSVWRDQLKNFQERIEQQSFSDPIAARLAALMKSRRAKIDHVLRRASQLAMDIRDVQHERVLCHSDLHAGNILVDLDEKLSIVDWDQPILAPRERDLMFIGAGIDRLWPTVEDEERFYQGYGAVDLDLECLAYYRYERIVQDMAAYCEQLLSSSAGGQDRQDAFTYFSSNFLPGGTIEMAQKVDPVYRSENR